MASTVLVRILGGFELVVDGTPRPLAGMRQRAVLALLVLHRGQALSVDRIVDELWADHAPATARKTVQVYVSQLRRALGDAASLLATTESGYAISAAVATDVDEFERLRAEAQDMAAGGRPAEAAAGFAAALDVWRGDPLSDFTYEPFAREEIALLTDRRLAVIEQRVDADLAHGRDRDLVGELEALVARNPLRERLRGLLMLALYRSGRQAEALEAFQAGRRVLADELGIDPGPDLRALHEAILAHDASLDAPRGRGTASAPSRRLRALAAGGALLVLAAAAAAALELTGGGGGTVLAGVPGDHVGEIAPATGSLVAAFPVGRTPTSVAVGSGSVWVLNADARTISRIDPSTGAVETNGTGSTPAGLAVGGGSVWVSYDPSTGRGQVRIRRLDPHTLAPEGEVALPPAGIAEGDQPLAYAAGALWAIDPTGDLDRIDPRTGHVRTAARGVGAPLAAGLGAVWAAAQGQNGTTDIVRVDVRTGGVRRLHTPVLQLEGLAAGAGAVWATDESTGSVWRIQPTRPPIVQSAHVGLGAGPIAVGGGAVWVASGIDGTVSRVAANDVRVERTIATGNTPQGLAYGGGRVWVSVADGGGGAVTGGAVTAARGAIPALPEEVCGPVFYAGAGRPDALIASDFPFENDGPQTRPMVEAIKFVLREHRFRAGRFRIGYQACDDGTAASGAWTAGKCDANARAFAATRSVIGVIGPYNSGCAIEEIPIANRAGLAMVSPSNSYLGLTRGGPGVLPNDPAALYPAGRRTYVRVYPPDDTQARAQAVLAHELGRRRVFVVRDTGVGAYGGSVAASFVRAARSAGVVVTGDALWLPSVLASSARARAADLRAAAALARRIRASGASVVEICGLYESYGGDVIQRLRTLLGSDTPFILDDGFLFDPPPGPLARARPVYITNSGISDPSRQLPPAGRAFVATFRGTQPAREDDVFFVYAAQSVEVLLQAIARSDGTRASVVSHLLHVRVRNGLLGSFTFTPGGDITIDRVGVYTITANGAGVALDHTITLHNGAGGS